MTAITLDRFLPQSSFFTMPECIQARSEEDLLVGRVAQCLLALHRRPKEATLSPGSASLKLISDTASKVSVAYANLAKPGGAAAALSPTSQLAAWLLCLEERSLTAASLVKRFHSLSTDIQDFLAKSVAKTLALSDHYGRAEIEEDPYILLRIRNGKGETLVEEALETLHKQEIYAPLLSELETLQTYEPTADKTLLTRVTESPLFHLLCYFVWWEDGGKDDPHFGSLTHGEGKICASPEILWQTQGGSSRLKRLQEEIRSQTRFHARAREEKELPLVNDQLDKRFCEELLYTYDIRPEAIENNIPQIRLEIFLLRLRDHPFPTNYTQVEALFPILDAKELVERMKVLAEINPVKVNKHMAAYGIKESTGLSEQDKFRALVEIAKITAAQKYAGTSFYIANYGIATWAGMAPRERFRALGDIARIAAAQSGVAISFHIANYGIATLAGITPQKRFEALVDIARISAAQNGAATSFCIANYGIATFEGVTPQERFRALVDIAMTAATENGGATSEHIANYEIATLAGMAPQERFRALVDIARIAATQDGGSTSEHIANYEIATLAGIAPQERFKALVDIAKKATRHDYFTSSYIANYGIATFEGVTPQERFEALTELAMSAVKTMGAHIFLRLKQYKFDSVEGISPEVRSKALLEIAKIAIRHPFRGDLDIEWPNYGMTASDFSYAKALHQMRVGAEGGFILSDTSTLPDLSELEKFYSDPFIKLLSDEAEEVIAAASERQERLYNRHRMHVAMATLLMLSLKEPYRSDGATKNWLEKSLFQILRYPSYSMQTHLTFLLTELCSDNPSLYLDLVFGLQKEALCLLQISIATLARQAGKSKEEIKAIYEVFSNFPIFKNTPDFVNALNMLQSLCLCALEPEEKCELLGRICSHKLTQKAFHGEISQLYALIELSISKTGCLPEGLREEFTPDQLDAAFLRCIKTDLFGGIDLTPEETGFIEESYFPLTKTMRRPFGLEVYAARISRLDDRPLMEAFKRFALSLFKGTYREERYKTEGNPHLEKMSKEYPEIWMAWQSLPAPALVEEVVSPPASGGGAGRDRATRFFFSRWLTTKLLTDKHLLAFEKTCPRLFAFLSKGTRFPKGRGSAREQIEDLCMELCQTILSPEDILAKMKNLKTLVNSTELFTSSQWKRDIDGLYRTLSTTKQEAPALIMITDDWQDMFLSGTEVSGNCQRIDGDPSWNQCLVSECLDGKMQYVSIADLSTKKILANAELKLLFIHAESAEGTLLLEPAVFMERIYPDAVSEEYKAALYTLAKARAASLGLRLYEATPFNEPACEIYTLESLGSSAPYEYEDGGEGVTKGTYTIEGVLVS